MFEYLIELFRELCGLIDDFLDSSSFISFGAAIYAHTGQPCDIGISTDGANVLQEIPLKGDC